MRLINCRPSSFGRRLAFRLLSSSSEAERLQVYQKQSKQRLRARRFAWLMTWMVLPISCISLYDRLAPLPEPLDRHPFPLLARIYIRKALLMNKEGDVDGLAKDLDSALGAVLSAGLGAASPQATALLVFLSQRYLEDSKTPSSRLEEALAALLHKPHVGESLEDEQARLEMGMKVLGRLHGMYNDHRAGELLDRYETAIKRCPPRLSLRLQHQFSNLKQSLH